MNDTQSKTATYECFGVIVQGSVATLYDGYDHLLKREVVIKELRPEFRHDAEIVAAFWGEATLLAGLNHANLLRIYGIDHERHWIIMEPMQGSLASEGLTAKVSSDRVRDILKQVLEGLRYLHSMDRVHGQIRLDSLLVDSQGNVKLSNLSDFALDGEFKSPSHKQLHCAPEILNPRHFGQPGLNSDLYSVGIVALQLLTGDKFIKLFKGMDRKRQQDPIAWSAWHASSESIAPIQSISAGLPADLIALVEGLTQKQVGLRFATAAEALGTITATLSLNDNLSSPPRNASANEDQSPDNTVAVTYNSPNIYSPRSASAAKKKSITWQTLYQEAAIRFPVLHQRKTLLAVAGLSFGFLMLTISLSSAESKPQVQAAANDAAEAEDDSMAKETAVDTADTQVQSAPPPARVVGSVKVILAVDPMGASDISQARLLIDGEELEKTSQSDEVREAYAGLGADPANAAPANDQMAGHNFKLTQASDSAPYVLEGPPGTYEVEVRVDGYQNCKREVVVVASEEQVCRVGLVPESYIVDFNIQPASVAATAKLIIDGQIQESNSSMRPVRLPWGIHYVHVSADDHQDWVRKIDVREANALNVPLQPVPSHAVTLDSFPQGAVVEVDGKPIGRTPVSWRGVEGKHRIQLQLNGFATVDDRFTSNKGTSRLLWYLDKPINLLARQSSAD